LQSVTLMHRPLGCAVQSAWEAHSFDAGACASLVVGDSSAGSGVAEQLDAVAR
jgi:hypothetical protein